MSSTRQEKIVGKIVVGLLVCLILCSLFGGIGAASKGKIKIVADNTEVIELNTAVLTITGTAGHKIHVEAIFGTEGIEFIEGKKDLPEAYNFKRNGHKRVDGTRCISAFDIELDSKGRRTFAVRFHDMGIYTVKAYDYYTSKDDAVDINVFAKYATFDMPSTCIIGEDLIINGMANAGDFVDIAIDDIIVKTDISIEKGIFYVELPTLETGYTNVPGSYKITAFIRAFREQVPAIGTDVSDWEADGATVVLMICPWLTANLSKSKVELGDKFAVDAEAPGSDFIDIFTIAPRGGAGIGLQWLNSDIGDVTGLTYIHHIRSNGYNHSIEIEVNNSASIGSHFIVVLSPGMDELYSMDGTDDILRSINSTYFGGAITKLTLKGQGQIMEILQDVTATAGSDDLMWACVIEVDPLESTEVILNPVEDVAIGEVLIVTGNSSKEDGYPIVVMLRGAIELPPITTYVKNGEFTAYFDTSNTVEGSYLVLADDGEMHVDTTTVDILTSVLSKVTDTTSISPLSQLSTSKTVTFTMSNSCIIGADLIVSGTVSEGDFIDIAIENEIVETNISLEDGTFYVELATPETAHTGVPGAVIIEAFVRSAGEEPLPYGADVSWLSNNGLTAVLMESGSLTTELSTDAVAHGDDFSLSGIAQGLDFVDVLTISPRGGGGTGLKGKHGDIEGVTGVTHDRLAVFSADWSYFGKIDVDENAQSGYYDVAVLSPGRDGIYNGVVTNDLIEGLVNVYGLLGKTQDQILSILEAMVYAAGSDDLLWIAHIKVEIPYVSLNPISAVHIGEPLIVTGTTNWKDGSQIIIYVRGPVGLTPQTADVVNKTFEATFDTTDAIAGTYWVKADDGVGHTDEVEVVIS